MVHVMSAWQAHCLPWQSWKMNPVRYSGYKLELYTWFCNFFLRVGHLIYAYCLSFKRVNIFQKGPFQPSFEGLNVHFGNSTHKIKCNREPGFYGEVGKVKGQGAARWALPAGQLSVIGQRERHTSVCSIHHAHKSSLSTRCKCACMRGNTNTSSTYNRASIIASLLESRGEITQGLS